MDRDKYKVDKIPSIECPKCKSIYIMVTDSGLECDNCDKPNVRSTKLELKIERCDRVYRKTKESKKNEVK